jgi:hypothetical protein
LLFFGYRSCGLLERGSGELLRIQGLEQMARGRKAARPSHCIRFVLGDFFVMAVTGR